MLRKMLVPVLGALALALFAGPAFAAPAVPKGTAFDVTYPAGQLCDDEINLKGVNGQVERPSANFSIVTGPAVITVTNTSTLKSATFNISGPGITSGNTLILPGPQLVLILEEFAPPPHGLIYTTGRGTIDLTPTNLDFDFAGFKGRSTDVCAALA
jgi:hypothetical protein